MEISQNHHTCAFCYFPPKTGHLMTPCGTIPFLHCEGTCGHNFAVPTILRAPRSAPYDPPEDQKGATKRRNSRPPMMDPETCSCNAHVVSMWFPLVSHTLDVNVLPYNEMHLCGGWSGKHLIFLHHLIGWFVWFHTSLHGSATVPWSQRSYLVVTESMAYAILDLTIRGSTRWPEIQTWRGVKSECVMAML